MLFTICVAPQNVIKVVYFVDRYRMTHIMILQVRNPKPQSFNLYKQLRSLIAGNLFSTTFNSDSQQSEFLIVFAVSLSKPLLHWWRSNGLHHDFDQSETRNFNYSTFTNNCDNLTNCRKLVMHKFLAYV